MYSHNIIEEQHSYVGQSIGIVTNTYGRGLPLRGGQLTPMVGRLPLRGGQLTVRGIAPQSQGTVNTYIRGTICSLVLVSPLVQSTSPVH